LSPYGGNHPADPTLANLLKSMGYMTGQFGKNHLGDRNDMLPTVHGFDEWFGNLYHLNAEDEPENRILHSPPRADGHLIRGRLIVFPSPPENSQNLPSGYENGLRIEQRFPARML
jgi:arylsulfatase A-like enzyme